tara:strand:- start:117 stop:1325 length:1209 start_codon:yes stop_codon:yes gene_type:complete
MANKTSSFTDYNPPSVDGAWLNIQQTEMNNLITGSGLTVDNTGLVNTQEQQSVSRFAANNFYIDSGAADAYVLTLAASFTNPVSATVGYFVGMTIRFRAGNAGTGGTATVNVNQAGVKSLKEADGTTNSASIPTTEDLMYRYDGTVFRKVNAVVVATESVAGIAKLPKQITIANNATDANNDIDFSAGNFQFSDGTGIASLYALTKRLDASWVAGTNQGGLFSGAKANSTWYHCFAIYNPTSGVVDCGFDTSVSAANIPSGYTKYKRVGSIRTDGSGNILGFNQCDKTFIYKAPTIIDRAVAAAPTSPTNLTVTAPPNSFVLCSCHTSVDGDANLYTIVCATDASNLNASSTNFTYASQTVVTASINIAIMVKTNGSSQISIDSTSSQGLQITTRGFIDYQL